MIFLSSNDLNHSTNQAMEDRMTYSPFMKKLITYLLILLSISFIIGTFTLTLLLKSIVIYMRNTGWLSSSEYFVIFVISSFILILTLLFAKWLTIWFCESTNRSSKVSFSVMVAILLLLCLFRWLPDAETPFAKNIASNDKRFIGGPYPDLENLTDLKNQGITTVVSLLDPLALPAEPFLIKEEEKAIASLGLNLIRIPMLSGSVEDLEANKRIQEVAMSEANEKYYVHGYRDQERVLMFIKQVDQHTTKTVSVSTPAPVPTAIPAAIPTPKLSSPTVQPATVVNGHNTINLERGTAIQLDDHVIVSPKPTMDELKQYFINTPNAATTIPIRSVISLSPDEKSTETSEITKLLKEKHIAYYALPIQLYPYDANAVLKIVEKVKSLTGGVLVYSYYMPPQSTAISAFMLAYLTNLPPLPNSLFMGMPMQNGTVKTVAPNVAIGPRPADNEFKDYLKARGINGIGYAGPCDSQESKTDEAMAKLANLKWTCLQVKDNIVLNALKTNGPWYVYGPVLPLIETELTKRMNKLMPDHPL